MFRSNAFVFLVQSKQSGRLEYNRRFVGLRGSGVRGSEQNVYFIFFLVVVVVVVVVVVREAAVVVVEENKQTGHYKSLVVQ